MEPPPHARLARWVKPTGKPVGIYRKEFFVVSTVAFVVVLGVLIFFHELGHYLAARWLGVKVLKFSLGFGPKLFGRTVGDTEYVVSILPLGGYVKLAGEEPPEDGSPETLTPEERRESFSHQSVGRRSAIVAAGPIFNFILAYLLFSGGLAVGMPMYVPNFASLTATVDGLKADGPAAVAGLKVGDKILTIDEKRVTTWVEMTDIVRASAGKELSFEVERDEQRLVFLVTPAETIAQTEDGEEVKVGQIGIEKKTSGTPIEAINPIHAFYKGFEATWKWTELTVVGIGKLITRQISADNIGGPIMIFQMSGNVASEGVMSLAMFIAILSINLGIINFLPIPVLDGGHLFFFAIEAVLGRPLSIRKREIAQQVGLVLLIGLMLLAFYNDIARLFQPG